MKELLKPIFELMTGDYILLNNVIYNYIAMTIIGLLAFVFAWNFVGKLYNEKIIHSSESGSIIHWIIRIILFIIIFYVFSAIIWITKFILKWKTYFSIAVLLLIILLIAIKLIKYKKNIKY